MTWPGNGLAVWTQGSVISIQAQFINSVAVGSYRNPGTVETETSSELNSAFFMLPLPRYLSSLPPTKWCFDSGWGFSGFAISDYSLGAPLLPRECLV